MTNAATAPSSFKRVINGLIATALGVFVLGSYWPLVELLDLSRADLQCQGIWIGGHARQITAVTPGGVGDRAGLRAGDVLEFDIHRDVDWVLAGYRQMPEGFSTTLPVRHADGTSSVAMLAPKRIAYLTTLNDRLALLARLCAVTIFILVVVFLVWARPSLMTWALLLGSLGALPVRPWAAYFLAFQAGPDSSLMPFVMVAFQSSAAAIIVFALCFPHDTLPDWAWWKRALLLTAVLAVIIFNTAAESFAPFERDAFSREDNLLWSAYATAAVLFGIAALAYNYRRLGALERARLKWAVLGIAVVWVGNLLSLTALLRPVQPSPLSGSGFTSLHWVMVLSMGIMFPFVIGYAILRRRVVDVQFAVSRTVVFGVISTLALVFIAAVHWLLGRMLEQSRLAIGLEGLAAIGLGLVLHRAARGANLLVDRVLFRKHHQAEERLRRVTAALPYATDERSITEAVVTEPVRNLDLASAALFYRESSQGPLRRVLGHGWGGSHAASLDADSLLLRYLQAEHAPLKLDDPHLLPASIPDGAARPVLAIPVVTQHDLTAVVLYGSHVNHTLLDPDEVELLHALARAAATSHQHVRVATLAREVSALTRETELQKVRNEQLEASLRVLAQARMAGNTGAGTSGKPA